MIIKKRKLSERKLMALSCGSYLLGIVCMTILGYFYGKIPYRNLLYIIPICLLLFGAIFSCMLHIMYLWVPFVICIIITFIMSRMNVEKANKELISGRRLNG